MKTMRMIYSMSFTWGYRMDYNRLYKQNKETDKNRFTERD